MFNALKEAHPDKNSFTLIKFSHSLAEELLFVLEWKSLFQVDHQQQQQIKTKTKTANKLSKLIHFLTDGSQKATTANIHSMF